MPTITLNGAPRVVSGDTTIIDLVSQTAARPLASDGRPLDGGGLGMAVAVDAAVVPRSRWSRTPVLEGQTIEIITAVQGG
ncbi:sulfur carrier protein ThiS [uncultured Citricoccus sp.]|uniref:sulfur carrier protein ThiS n=1 Tax=uncultured Citricoccus sp. TaxID=614031 RepID=UPI002602AC59|nr:sulfur carrier protein ThiS [uncultured Citricoccus sp.]